MVIQLIWSLFVRNKCEKENELIKNAVNDTIIQEKLKKMIVRRKNYIQPNKKYHLFLFDFE